MVESNGSKIIVAFAMYKLGKPLSASALAYHVSFVLSSILQKTIDDDVMS